MRALALRFALLATLALASLPGCSRDLQPAPDADGDFVTALDIFEDAAREWAAEGVPMWVFVDLTAGDAGPRAP